MRMRLCIPCLLASIALAVWSAAVWGQPPGGLRGGFSFNQVLERHDKDGDGKVTRKEWQGPEEFFGRMDANGDGVLTKEEFQARMQARGGFGGGFGGGRVGPGGPGRPGGSGSPPETSPQLDAARMLWLLDANKDGSVSAEEVKSFFDRADSDRSGSLSKEELAKALTTPPPTPSIVEGQQAGIEVGQCPPDFELQPIEPYAKFRDWLGDGAPRSIEEKVKLSQLVGKQPILLLYGSYT